MADKITDFAAFKSRRAEESDAPAAEAAAVRAAHDRVVALLHETADLVDSLDDGVQRAFSRAIARGEPTPRDTLAAMVRGYERLSWKLHGQLRHILDTSRKY